MLAFSTPEERLVEPRRFWRDIIPTISAKQHPILCWLQTNSICKWAIDRIVCRCSVTFTLILRYRETSRHFTQIIRMQQQQQNIITCWWTTTTTTTTTTSVCRHVWATTNNECVSSHTHTNPFRCRCSMLSCCACIMPADGYSMQIGSRSGGYSKPTHWVEVCVSVCYCPCVCVGVCLANGISKLLCIGDDPSG